MPVSMLSRVKPIATRISSERTVAIIEDLLQHLFIPLNLALFYYSGRFYQISKRLLGIDYASVSCVCVRAIRMIIDTIF